METAKIFRSGRSQAVRLPKAFRLNCSEVRIRRQGNALVLEPLTTDWDWLAALVAEVDADFCLAVTEQPTCPIATEPKAGFG